MSDGDQGQGQGQGGGGTSQSGSRQGGQDQGQGQGDVTRQQGSSGESGPVLSPVAPGDVLTVTQGGTVTWDYRDRNTPPPGPATFSNQSSTFWRQTVTRQKKTLTLKVGDVLVVTGQAQGEVLFSGNLAAQDANLAQLGGIGVVKSTLTDDEPGIIIVWGVAPTLAAGPQAGTDWAVQVPADALTTTSQTVTVDAPPPPGWTPAALGLSGGADVNAAGVTRLPDGSFVVRNADGSETHLAADGTTWIGGAPPGGWRGAGSSPYAGIRYTDQRFVDSTGHETGALSAMLRGRLGGGGLDLAMGAGGLIALAVLALLALWAWKKRG